MYDLRVLRDNLDELRDQLGPRGKDVAWEDLRKLTEDRRAQTIQVEDLRHQLKKGSEEVARLKREKQPAEEAMAAMKALGETIKGHEDRLRLIEEQLAHIALRIPNLPHASVPNGHDAA
ncbi:MAG TPA: serine--tRNA ligase, partial [Nitrospira sp.]|nr:serine--tRNA ligase [Nitrospira sp.]HMX93297.1 serine--tRNA ligase [Nitrospira sp.]HNA48311.1 serine--tRNA ligase [Nitrospira sp.]HND03881.1 serine--tRNA ligase [Nitrospira sp.]HNG55601.1 serine--tRNA ligase [Nitrospira sp.]